jgi:3-hydroxyacyl-CoA dehydrogenase
MGRSIAAAAVDAGMDVILVDSDEHARENAAAKIVGELAAGYCHASAPAAKIADDRLDIRDSLESLGECDLILESIPESLAAKKTLFSALAHHVSPEVVLATNTSTLPLRNVLESVPNHGRFCGIHFCHPVARRELVEIIAAETTSRETVTTAVGLALRLGRFPVVVGDAAGFVVNRMLSPYLSAAFELLLDGIGPKRIDGVALAHGVDRGPLALADEIGLDVLLHGALVLREAYPDRFIGSAVPIALVKARRLGTKTGAGVYRYDANGKRHYDPSLEAILARYRRPLRGRPRSDGEIGEALFHSLGGEAEAISREKVAAWSGDVAAICVLGLGFPRGEVQIGEVV